MARPTSITMPRFFQALGDRTRLRLLNLMGEREICVCYFVEVLGAPQPTISRHLAYLRRAGLITARREGKWMHYRIAAPLPASARRALRQALAWMREDKQMQADRTRFMRACCSPAKYALGDAPSPAACGKPSARPASR